MLSLIPSSPLGMAAVTIDRTGMVMAHVLPGLRKRPRLAFLEREEGDDPAALQRLARRARLGKTPCVRLLLPGDYLLLTAETPAVPPEERPSAMKWQIKDRLPHPLEEMVVESFPLPESTPATPSIMGAVAAHRPLIQDHALLFRKAGLRLDVVDVPELAVLNLLNLLDESRTGMLLLHQDPHGALILVVRDGWLHLWRRLDGEAWRSDAPHERLALEIQRTLDYDEHRFRRPPITTLMVSGANAEMEPISPLADRLGLRVRPLPVRESFALDGPVSEALLRQHAPLLGAALRFTVDA